MNAILNNTVIIKELEEHIDMLKNLLTDNPVDEDDYDMWIANISATGERLLNLGEKAHKEMMKIYPCKD